MLGAGSEIDVGYGTWFLGVEKRAEIRGMMKSYLRFYKLASLLTMFGKGGNAVASIGEMAYLPEEAELPLLVRAVVLRSLENKERSIQRGSRCEDIWFCLLCLSVGLPDLPRGLSPLEAKEGGGNRFTSVQVSVSVGTP